MWKEIPGFDGLYFANENGQIKSADRQRKIVSHGKQSFYTRKGKILKPCLNPYGYYCVSISTSASATIVVASKYWCSAIDRGAWHRAIA